MANTTGLKFGGRLKGTPNKTTALLKDAILRAAELAGDGYADLEPESHARGLAKYLQVQSVENPGPFMTLLGKVLPMQVTGEDGGAVLFQTVYEKDRG